MDYQIKSGDTLWKIAKEQCGAASNADIMAKINEIAELNNIENPDLIFANDTLMLPGDTFEPNSETEEADEDNQPQTQEENTEQSGQNKRQTGQQTAIAQDFNNWVDEHGAAMDRYSDALDEYSGLLDNFYEDLNNGALDTEKIQEANDALAVAEQNYQDETAQIGDFSFVGEDVNLYNEDGKVNFDTYASQGEAFAQAMIDSWEQDGEEGTDYKEYYNAEIARMGDMEITSYIEDTIKDTFDMMDLNNDGIISTIEAQSIYSTIDMSDGSADGKINIDSYSQAPLAKDTIKENAVKFQERLEE